ncbi:GNAT family N-acetyltransferase [Akkermansiaceae bacterium]|nr:GNAT family N-acetyltransferase [Akkermansiaceae bacterium]
MAQPDDVDSIVELHCNSFAGFFLTSLGSSFLSHLYSSFVSDEHGVCIVAEDNNKIIGFVAGTPNPEEFFRRIKQTKLWDFAFSALPGFLKHPVLFVKKCFGALFYKGEPISSLSSAALLSSLSVDPIVSGRGIGKKLVKIFCSEMSTNNLSSVYLITDAEENDAVNIFYEKCGFFLEGSFSRSGNRIMNRWVKVLVE